MSSQQHSGGEEDRAEPGALVADVDGQSAGAEEDAEQEASSSQREHPILRLAALAVFGAAGLVMATTRIVKSRRQAAREKKKSQRRRWPFSRR